ncbi:MAG TPA: hypothetical protein DCL29_05020 [Eubacterium sp.]|nr:hypothetical protein [Eubacterium sp.]
MKLEKLSENSIRCTIDRKEFETYKIKLGEIINGNGNAPKFFKEIIYKAHEQFGFEPNNFPLIIEATANIPDNIVFTITKVNTEEEMEKMKKIVAMNQKKFQNNLLNNIHNVEDMDDLIQEIEDYKNNDATDEGDDFEESVIFMFSNVDNLITSAKQVDGIYKGVSDLYEIEGNYVLLLDAELEDAESYQYSCDIISEYADDTLFSDLTQSIILEHFEPVIEGDALTQLAKL